MMVGCLGLWSILGCALRSASWLSAVAAESIALLGDGETHLLALVTLFMIKLLQWIYERRVVLLAMAHNVNSLEDSMTQGTLVACALSRP